MQEALHLLETMPGGDLPVRKEQWSFLDASKPLPFEELLAPFVSLAQQRFLEQAGKSSRLCTDAVHVTMQQHLLHVLVSLSVQTLHAEFTRVSTQVSVSVTGENEQIDEQFFYQRFIQQMYQGGLATLLRTYSVLARLLATTCQLWVAANAEFVQRLSADWPTLEQTFGAENVLGQVIEIEPALSDTYTGRRSVMALTFASGFRLVYKPRSVGTEEAFSHLLNWCSAQGATPPFKALSILNCSNYGWAEFVDAKPCQDLEELRRYYQRAGMLLCLVYILGGVDCFSDQLIAHGEQPVLVDASNLLHSFASPHPQHRAGEDWQQALYSVLHTGLLASWRRPSPGSAPARNIISGDISGLGFSQGYPGLIADTREIPPQVHQALKYGSFKPREILHMVTLAGASEGIGEEELHSDFYTGFQRMYQLLLQQRIALLADESPLHAFKTLVVRFPYRDRRAYSTIFPKLLEPQLLQDAVTRSMYFDQLGWNSVPIDWFRAGKRDRARWWAVFTAERQALMQGDVPVINARANSDALLLGPDWEVASCLCQPGFDPVLRRVEQMSLADLDQQLALLNQALPQKITPVVIRAELAKKRGESGEWTEAPFFETQALAIADTIASRAIETSQDSVIWVDPAFLGRFQNYQIQPMRYDFAGGISGIAFFLAALARRTGISRYRKLARAAVRPLRQILCEEGERLVREMGLGASCGLGSVVYALTRVSEFLDEPGLLVDARSAARLITPERIADDSLLDIHMGAAGAILGLLALYKTSPEQDVLDRAVHCGQHLLRVRTLSQAGCRGWRTLGGRYTTGFAHGTAGIVYALLRLYEVTGERELLEAAQEGLRYEDRAFVHERGNWIEEVGGAATDFGVSWCHGAPGIGLARLGGLPLLDTPSIRQDIEIALQTTQQIGAGGVDHLCCGICGRVEFLLTAARRLERPDLAEVAEGWIKQMLTKAEQRKAFALNLILPKWVSHPQLFQGAAGIGYTLLRCAQPDTLPSPLLWE
jgi:type 2 lantibiotic biosynthesis protein LanM